MNAYDVTLVPVIMGLVQVAKQLGMPARFASLLSVVLGALAGIFYLFPDDLLKGIFGGLTFGLAACGLYSGGKNTAQTIQARKQANAQTRTLPEKNKNEQA